MLLNILRACACAGALAHPRLTFCLKLSKIWVDDCSSRVAVEFVPTIPHCSASTLIGLSIRIKLQVGVGGCGSGLGFLF